MRIPWISIFAIHFLLLQCRVSVTPEWIFSLPLSVKLLQENVNSNIDNSCGLGFTKFEFLGAINHLNKDYSAAPIDPSLASIQIQLPYGVVPRAVASFLVNDPEAQVFVNNNLQDSGVTKHDFSQPIEYEIRKEECSKKVVVIVDPIQPVWDTGQISCYDNITTIPCNWHGSLSQDGDFLDVPNPREFSKYELISATESIVWDELTGLVWMGCVPFLSPNSDCAAGSVQLFSYSDAQNFCSSLNTFNSGQGYAGFKNWRLPTVQELVSIIDREKLISMHGMVDPNSFPNNPGDNIMTWGYWTLTESPYSPNYNYNVRFELGSIIPSLLHVMTTDHNTTLKVRCVSGGMPPNKEFEILENGKYVLDKKTNLVWERCVYGQMGSDCSVGSPIGMDWYSSLQECVSIDKGWRLPNSNEILSIFDFSVPITGFPPTIFPNSLSGSWNYWTSTTFSGYSDRAITIQAMGIMDQDHKSSPGTPSFVRCVKSN